MQPSFSHERESTHCLVCYKEYDPYHLDASLVERYLATFDACMNLQLNSLEKANLENEYFPFCDNCLLVLSHQYQLQREIDSLHCQLMKNTWKLTTLILESQSEGFKGNINMQLSPSSSKIDKIRKRICKRYEVFVKIHELKPLRGNLQCEQCETYDDLPHRYQEVTDSDLTADPNPTKINERKPKSSVTQVGDRQFLYDGTFSFIRAGENFQCDGCEYSSKNKYSVVQHIRLSHAEPTKGIKCKTCGKKFKNSKTLFIHEQSHTSTRFACNICDKEFKHASSMYFHQRCHHKDNENTEFKCNECSKIFFKRADLDRHKVTHTKEKKFNCLHCGAKFARRNAWRVHTVHNMNPGGSSSCNFCSDVFSFKCALTAHTMKMHKDLCIKQSVQNRVPKQRSNVLSKNSTLHNKDKADLRRPRVNPRNNKVKEVAPDTFLYGDRFSFRKQDEEYECLTCSYKSVKRVRVINHIRHVHLYTYQFVCEYCGSSFKLPSELRKHQRIHVTESLYMCEECGSKFRTSDSLRSHKKTHLRKPENVFECDLCNKKYQYKKTLNEHMSQHVNQGEKKFECPECNKRFCNKRSRNFHSKCHRSEKERQFSCDLCRANFTHSYGLKRHSRIYHAGA